MPKRLDEASGQRPRRHHRGNFEKQPWNLGNKLPKSFVLTRNQWLTVFCDIDMEHHRIAANWAIFNIVLVESFSYIDWHDYLFTT
jgi:hypothetical protein